MCPFWGGKLTSLLLLGMASCHVEHPFVLLRSAVRALSLSSLLATPYPNCWGREWVQEREEPCVIYSPFMLCRCSAIAQTRLCQQGVRAPGTAPSGHCEENWLQQPVHTDADEEQFINTLPCTSSHWSSQDCVGKSQWCVSSPPWLKSA